MHDWVMNGRIRQQSSIVDAGHCAPDATKGELQAETAAAEVAAEELPPAAAPAAEAAPPQPAKPRYLGVTMNIVGMGMSMPALANTTGRCVSAAHMRRPSPKPSGGQLWPHQLPCC